jgi:hypothetical protein
MNANAVTDSERRRRRLRVVLSIALVVGTLCGVIGTSLLALVLASPGMYASGLEPRPENALWAWMVSPRVSGVATQGLLLLLGGTTVWLAAALVADVRRIWRAYAAWAAVGGVLTAYALAANWQLAREAGTLALVVGGLWSVAVAFAIARTEPTAVGT